MSVLHAQKREQIFKVKLEKILKAFQLNAIMINKTFSHLFKSICFHIVYVKGFQFSNSKF